MGHLHICKFSQVVFFRIDILHFEQLTNAEAAEKLDSEARHVERLLGLLGDEGEIVRVGSLFFHHTALADVRIEELRDGQRVEYEEGEGPKGPRAQSVRPI